MNMLQVRQQIATKQVDSKYIFIGEEYTVLNIYISEICKVLGAKRKYVDTVKAVSKEVQSESLFQTPTVYVVVDDMEFCKNPLLDTIDANIILVYTRLDKRSKFYKEHKNKIVEFNKLNPKYLVKHIQDELDVSARGADKLSSVCEDNYGRIMLEVDKIKTYMSISRSNADSALYDMLTSGAIYTPPYDAIFDLIDAIMRRDNKAVFKLYEDCKGVGEANLAIISVLYNTIKRVMLVQSCRDQNAITETTGLTPWDIKCAKKHVGYYETIELVNALKVVQSVEVGIKTGKIDDSMAVDYILISILK